MSNEDQTDYPVLVPFSLGVDRYLLKTKASVLNQHLAPNWPSMTAEDLEQAVWSALEAKAWLGPIDSPDEIEAALEENRHEDWYVIGISNLTRYALTSKTTRYPHHRVLV